MRQIVKDGELSWKDAEAVKDIWSLFLAVRRVRNNLFHGGKLPQPIGPIPDVSRDQKLLAQTLGVLQFALEKSPHLKELFWPVSRRKRARRFKASTTIALSSFNVAAIT
jgi:hypothetical protein